MKINKVITLLYIIVVSWNVIACSKVDIYNLVVDNDITEGSPNVNISNNYHNLANDNTDYFVTLNGNSLQPNESGRWTILSGKLHQEYVYFKDPNNPKTKFFGIPDEEYTLLWTVSKNDVNTSKEIKVKIQPPTYRMIGRTPKEFKTKIYLETSHLLRGRWTFDKEYVSIRDLQSDGYSKPSEQNFSINVQGKENTTYNIRYTYELFDKEFHLDTTISTGDYQQLEALNDLNLGKDSHAVIWNKDHDVIAINLTSSGYARNLEDWQLFPTLKSLKKIKKINLTASSISNLPKELCDNFPDLEEIIMPFTGYKLKIPENINKLTKLKKFIWTPGRASHLSQGVINIPEQFGELENLEHLNLEWEETINLPKSFGKLKNLTHWLGHSFDEMPDNIGGLTKLKHMEVFFKKGGFKSSFSNLVSLKYLRVHFIEKGTTQLPSDINKLRNLNHFDVRGEQFIPQLPETFGELVNIDTIYIEGNVLGKLNANFGNLKKLQYLLLGTSISSLPESFGDLASLKWLSINATNLRSLPESFGNLKSLEAFSLYGPLEYLPTSFGNLQNLKYLVIQHSNLKSVPKSFAHLNIEKLDLIFNKFEKFPEEFCKLKKIHTIHLNYNDIEALPESLVLLKDHLATLTLYGNTRLKADDMRSLALKMRSTILLHDNFSSYALNLEL